MANAAKAEGNFELARGSSRGGRRVVAGARRCARRRLGANGLGDVAASQGDHDAARRYHHREPGQVPARSTIAGALRACWPIWPSVDLRGAATTTAADASLTEALQAFRALGHQRGVARQLESLSWCASCQSRDEEAVRLAGAAAAIRQRIGTPAKPAERERDRPHAGGGAGAHQRDAFAHAWNEGRTATLDRLLGIETLAPRRDRAQAYFLGSMSRRTAEIRLAGTPSLRACSPDRRFVRRQVDAVEPIVGHVAVQPLNLRADGFQDLERPQRDVPNLVFGHLARPRGSRVR